ncbi:hypothetical protein C6P40_000202 [Pichia californica]|uniref:NADH dehydrogenase [ubiquinone] 1 alpha subcomplex assembly factor 3 n=1 Tax=Pichia californica TaxID=460514 RepID=A0A9P7BGC1_9ASCO|nr:hypothetical protein C6P42_000364 [[Candida] californica]KAG0689030.1 hypothetical protein C6P40_000202 [[Candida] californica]
MLGKRLFHSTSRVPRHYTTTFKASNLGQNLAKYDIYALADKPENNVEMISKESIIFSNLKVISNTNLENPIGALLLSNQIFEISLKGLEFKYDGVVVEFDDKILDIFELVYPKPELLVAGLGKRTRMLGPKTKERLNKLGIRVETGDTRSSALSYDLLATERSPFLVASIMLPPNI